MYNRIKKKQLNCLTFENEINNFVLLHRQLIIKI